MNSTTQYYNAKPSNISNLGVDLANAKRHNFDTYETTEEREARERKKALDNGLKEIKAKFKALILSDSPCYTTLKQLLNDQFRLQYGFDLNSPDPRGEARDYHSKVTYSEYNKMVRAYNALKRDIRDLSYEHYAKYYFAKMRKKYSPKTSFTEQSGARFDWKKFTSEVTDLPEKVEYLRINTRAIQFGNSVSDKERGYILIQMSEFLSHWKIVEGLNTIDLSPVGWSFGARGKAGSVAYFQPSSNIISVNRDRIGSLIHEVGHYIDYSKGLPSNKISYDTVRAYAETLPKEMSSKDRRYYCSRKEIFARAFEAYCFKIYAGFSEFAQVGKDYLPELNSELIEIIEGVLK
jgi:hypothetical protein